MRGKVRIEMGTHGRYSRVFINDEDVSSLVSGISVEVDVDSIPQVTLALIPDSVEIEGEADVLKIEGKAKS